MDAVEVNQKFSQLMNTNPLVRGAAAMGALHGLDANESLRLIVAALVEENERLASDNLRLKGIVPRGVVYHDNVHRWNVPDAAKSESP